MHRGHGVDGSRDVSQTHEVSATLIVLNGPSSAGKTTIARSLQARWPQPLFVSGIDTFIAGWPETFVSAPGEDGSPATPSSGLRIAPGRGPAPSLIVELGVDFRTLMHTAHETWRAIQAAGLDQVVDHVLVDEELRRDALATLPDACWVGVTCELDELVRRESSRGDRMLGLASGTSAVVHRNMSYDLIVDTTRTSSEDNADLIVAALISTP